LLTMDQDHYETKVWPLLFYISRSKFDKWQMNAARALGNRGDRADIPLLIQTLSENPHELVRAMATWSLGKLGGNRAQNALVSQLTQADGLVKQEI